MRLVLTSFSLVHMYLYRCISLLTSLYVQRAQLDLESMQQKCDAWREEVEELTPLKDEVAHLHQENARLQQEVARASEVTLIQNEKALKCNLARISETLSPLSRGISLVTQADHRQYASATT